MKRGIIGIFPAAGAAALLVAAFALVWGCGGGGGGGGATFRISSVSPSAGNAAGGTTVTVNGSLFEVGAAEVWFGTYDELTFPAGCTEATAYTTQTGSQIVCTAPAGAGTVDVIVHNPTDDVEAVRTAAYTYVTGLDLTGISPSEGPLSGGNTVTITCDGTPAFADGVGLQVVFDYGGDEVIVPRASITVASGTQITLPAPGHGPAYDADIQVRNGDYGTDELTSAYSFKHIIGSPDDSGFTDADTDGGTTIVIRDTTSGDVDGSTTVTVGGVTLTSGVTTDSPNAEDITVDLPPMPEGFYDITYTTDVGTVQVTLTDAVYFSNPDWTIYVADYGDDDAGDGTAAKPYRSITKGLRHFYPSAVPAGWTVLCLAGSDEGAVFSKAYGEIWPLAVPTGVRLQGAGSSRAIIRGGSQSYECVYFYNCGPGSVLDGFTIDSVRNSGGSGGAIFVNGGRAAISNCYIYNNWVTAIDCDGGGLAVTNDASVSVSDCSFQTNKAEDCGGAVAASAGCVLSFSRCTFETNTADYNQDDYGDGGAVFIGGASTVLRMDDCLIEGNVGDYGGGLAISQAGPWVRLTRCVFSSNYARQWSVYGGIGGGIYAICDDLLAQNCLFYQNYAEYYGGGVAFIDCGDQTATLLNCTIVQNIAAAGGLSYQGDGVYVANTAASSNSCPLVKNCIFWDNDYYGLCEHPQFDEATYGHKTDPYVDYNCWYAHYVNWNYVDEGSTGLADPDGVAVGGGLNRSHTNVGNIATDPLFVAPTDPDGADGVYFTSDDGYVLDTAPLSPCINTGDPNIDDPDGSPSDMGFYGGLGAEGVERIFLRDSSTTRIDTVRLSRESGTLSDTDDDVDAGLTVLDAAQSDAYVVVLTATTLKSYEIHPASGGLTLAYPASTSPAAGQRLLVSGADVYTAESGTQNRIRHYTLNRYNGTLTYGQTTNDAPVGPSRLALVNGYVVTMGTTGTVKTYAVSNIALKGTLDLASAPVSATTFHDMKAVAGRYVVVHCSDATNEKLVTLSVSPTDGSLAVVTNLNTGEGTNISDVMIADANKVFLSGNSTSNQVSVFVAGSDGSLTEAAGSPFATTGTGTKKLAGGDGLLFCRNGTSKDLSVWKVNASTGVITAASDFPLDMTDSGTYAFLDTSAGKGKNGILYLGDGLLLLAGDDTADAKDLFLMEFDSDGLLVDEEISDTGLTSPAEPLLLE